MHFKRETGLQGDYPNIGPELDIIDCLEPPANYKKSIMFQLPDNYKRCDVFGLQSGESALYSSKIDPKFPCSSSDFGDIIAVLGRDREGSIFCITVLICALLDLREQSNGYVWGSQLKPHIHFPEIPSQPMSGTSSISVSGQRYLWPLEEIGDGGKFRVRVGHWSDPKNLLKDSFESINDVGDLRNSRVIIVGDALIHLKVCGSLCRL